MYFLPTKLSSVITACMIRASQLQYLLNDIIYKTVQHSDNHGRDGVEFEGFALFMHCHCYIVALPLMHGCSMLVLAVNLFAEYLLF